MALNPPAARLLVLVPEGDLPMVELAERIWALAAAAGATVMLVGLAEDPACKAETRRSLALLQSHTRFDPVPVSTRVACVPDWMAAVRQLRRPGDHVVCFPDQEAPDGMWGLGHQLLARALTAKLKVPALVIGDVPVPAQRHASRLRQAAWWLLSLAIIAGFFALQAWLQTAVAGSAGNFLLTLSVVWEFALLGALHQWRIRE